MDTFFMAVWNDWLIDEPKLTSRLRPPSPQPVGAVLPPAETKKARPGPGGLFDCLGVWMFDCLVV
jgi:hypothetical protein